MKAKDVMTGRVVSVAPDAPISEMARLMLEHNISGLPVIDGTGELVGIVTEGDCLRRMETGTERKRSHWMEYLVTPGRLAGEYVRSHGRKVHEIMTPEVVTVGEDTPLEEIVDLMESRQIKRVPVLRGRDIVGVVSRANLLHALAALAPEAPPVTKGDETIRDQVLAQFDKETWAPRNLINATVKDGVVDLWGVVLAAKQRDAAVVAAENVPGVKSVRSHLTWVEPMSGMVFDLPEE